MILWKLLCKLRNFLTNVPNNVALISIPRKEYFSTYLRRSFAIQFLSFGDPRSIKIAFVSESTCFDVRRFRVFSSSRDLVRDFAASSSATVLSLSLFLFRPTATPLRLMDFFCTCTQSADAPERCIHFSKPMSRFRLVCFGDVRRMFRRLKTSASCFQ